METEISSGSSDVRRPHRFYDRREDVSSERFVSTYEQFDRGALAALYEETFKNFEEGTIIEGRIVAVGKDKVVVDIGYKSEGMIPADQFSNDELQTAKPGDPIQVYI